MERMKHRARRRGENAPRAIHASRTFVRAYAPGRLCASRPSARSPAAAIRLARACRARALAAALLGLAAAAPLAAQPFALRDSGPADPRFRERFLATYGVNEAIEPQIGEAERALYKRVRSKLEDAPREAIRIVRRETEPGEKAVFDFLLGNLYYQTEQLDRAEKALERALEGFPNFRRAYRTLGLVYVRTDRFERAAKAWMQVIALGGGDAQSYGMLAYSRLTREQYESALAAYKRARMFEPESVDFRRGEAQCLLRIGEPERAAALFDELLADAPGTADYWRLQANAYLDLGRRDDAAANLEVVRAMGATTAASLRLLGDIYLRQKNHRLALRRYQAALRRAEQPDFEQAIRPLDHLANRGLWAEAEQYLGSLREQLPDDLPAEQASRLDVAEAGLALDRNEPKRARDLLRPIAEAEPLNGQALLLFAEALKRTGDKEKAAFYLERARSVPEFETDALEALGKLEVSRGNHEQALKHLRAAYERNARPALERYIEAVEEAR